MKAQTRCCLYSKGKNFRANHNREEILERAVAAVVYIAKVRILEQITTHILVFLFVLVLLFI